MLWLWVPGHTNCGTAWRQCSPLERIWCGYQQQGLEVCAEVWNAQLENSNIPSLLCLFPGTGWKIMSKYWKEAIFTTFVSQVEGRSTWTPQELTLVSLAVHAWEVAIINAMYSWGWELWDLHPLVVIILANWALLLSVFEFLKVFICVLSRTEKSINEQICVYRCTAIKSRYKARSALKQKWGLG